MTNQETGLNYKIKDNTKKQTSVTDTKFFSDVEFPESSPPAFGRCVATSVK